MIKNNYRWLIHLLFCISLANYSAAQDPSTKEKNNPLGDEPIPSTASIVTIGQMRPEILMHPKTYLSKYRGISKMIDDTCEEMIKTGHIALVSVPLLDHERPPGPLKFYIDKKNKSYISSSLPFSGTSMRIPVTRGRNFNVYLEQFKKSPDEIIKGKGKLLHSFPIAEDQKHILCFFTPAINAKDWKNYRVIPMDISPQKLPDNTAMVVNLSARNILFVPDNESPKNRRFILKSGSWIHYAIPGKSGSERLRYADANNPGRFISSVHCRRSNNKRSIVCAYDLPRPENKISVAARAFSINVSPLTPEEIVELRKKARPDRGD